MPTHDKLEAGMTVIDQITSYLESQPEPKRTEMKSLHLSIMGLFSDCHLSYLDGKDGQGRVVTNPNIGYGRQKMVYADGKTRDFYKIGMSANTSGISIYIMGLKDKKYLSEKYGPTLGKAKVTGYCIQFRQVADISREMLMAAIRDGIKLTQT